MREELGGSHAAEGQKVRRCGRVRMLVVSNAYLADCPDECTIVVGLPAAPD